MAQELLKGKVQEFKGQIQQQWGKLTDDDLDKMEGNRDELVGKVRQRYDLTKDEAESQVDKWLSKLS
ncbi:MAG: CsbD family protein [Trueperaceae bacterium]|nr:CsbD family protein [Trueperaceae bacterium]MDZ7705330.1 CsbD family protein [Trueperaceae bacterium]